MGFRRSIGVSMVGVAGLLASVIMTASPSSAAGWCIGHHSSTVGSITCTGAGPGTFYVVVTFCNHADGCYPKRGNTALRSGGTSSATAPAGMAYSYMVMH
jgi:hypothetical protein